MDSVKESYKSNEEKFSSKILNAPKFKLKIATLKPTPFSLNNYKIEESFNYNENSEQSLYEKEYVFINIPN